MRAARSLESGELLPSMRTALHAKPCQRTPDGFSTGEFTLSITEWKTRTCLPQGSPGARKRHTGKYGELTPSRQRGGGGGNASPLPTSPPPRGLTFELHSQSHSANGAQARWA